MPEVLRTLGRHPVKTRLSLTGSLIVARDIAHAKLKERLDSGEDLPQYFKDHAVYYAGPAKTPEGMPSGSFGPTTAGRMDAYVERFQAAGGSMVMLAKGNRSRAVTDSCERHGGFYLGSIGGPRGLPAIASRRSRLWSIRNSAWRPSGKSTWKLSGLHCRRRQGQRLFQGISEIKQGTDPDSKLISVWVSTH